MKVTITFLFYLLSIFSFSKDSTLIAYGLLLVTIFYKGLQIKSQKLITLLILPILFGTIYCFSNEPYVVFKDIYYLTIPIILWILGNQLVYIYSLSTFINIIIYSGTIVSILKFAFSLYFFGAESLVNPYLGRYAFNQIIATPAPVLSLGILIFLKLYKINFTSRTYFNIHFIINIIGIYLFSSRTYILILIIYIIVFLVLNRKIKTLLAITLIIASLYAIVIKYNYIFSENNTFISKVGNSFTEINTTNQTEDMDISQFYRGYESYRALINFNSSEFEIKLFGAMGKTVDLGTHIKLAGKEMRHIPLLHNGYLYLILKSGLLGIVSLLLYLYTILKKSFSNFYKSDVAYYKLVSLTCISITISIIIANYLVSTLYNIEFSVFIIALSFLNTLSKYIYHE